MCSVAQTSAVKSDSKHSLKLTGQQRFPKNSVLNFH